MPQCSRADMPLVPGPDERFSVLFLFDEFVSFGRMDVLANVITTLRSYGGQLMVVVQSIASLRNLYGKEGADVFLSNCRMQLFMMPADEETPNYISRAAGDYTLKTRSKSWRGNELAVSYGERVESARLIRPEQVRVLGADRIIALVQNMYPGAAYRITYHEDRHLARLYNAQTGPLPEPPVLPGLSGGETEPGSVGDPGRGRGLAFVPAAAGPAAGDGSTAESPAREATVSPAAGRAAASADDAMDEAAEQNVYSGLISILRN